MIEHLKKSVHNMLLMNEHSFFIYFLPCLKNLIADSFKISLAKSNPKQTIYNTFLLSTLCSQWSVNYTITPVNTVYVNTCFPQINTSWHDLRNANDAVKL